MKKSFLAYLLMMAIVLTCCSTAMAYETDVGEENGNNVRVQTVSSIDEVKEILQESGASVLYDGEVEIPLATQGDTMPLILVGTMNTRLVAVYDRNLLVLYVEIKNYSNNPLFEFYSMNGTITVVDEESQEVIISARPFTTSNVGSYSDIYTIETIENIYLYKGEKISITVTGTCLTNADIPVQAFSQTAHCVVNV